MGFSRLFKILLFLHLTVIPFSGKAETVEFQNVTLNHNVTHDGQSCLAIVCEFDVSGCKDQTISLGALFLDENGNALKEELDGLSVVAKFATTASDGKTYQVEYYNIELITSTGYRIKSKRGVQFRVWANKILKDYLLRGYSTLCHIGASIKDLGKKLFAFTKLEISPEYILKNI